MDSTIIGAIIGAVAGILGIFLATHYAHRSVDKKQNLNKLIEFHEYLEQLTDFPAEDTKMILQFECPPDEAVKHLEGFSLKLSEMKKKYKYFRPYMNKNCRSKVDALLASFMEQASTITDSSFISKAFSVSKDPKAMEYVENAVGGSPLEFLGILASSSWVVLVKSKEAVAENIEEIS